MAIPGVDSVGGGFSVSSPFMDDKRAKPNGRVLAFKLGGTAALPTYDAAPLNPATAPSGTFTEAQIERGGRLFKTTCSWCYGAGAVSGGVLPDLRRSSVLGDKDVWQQVVIGGILADRGMVSFSRNMKPADAEAVRAYVVIKSRHLAKEEGAR